MVEAVAMRCMIYFGSGYWTVGGGGGGGGDNGPPKLWQIGFRGADYAHHITKYLPLLPRIFRPSYGPGLYEQAALVNS